MATVTGEISKDLTIHSLRNQILPYAKSDLRKSILQLVNTFIPYISLWIILVYMVRHEYSFLLISPLILLLRSFLSAFLFFSMTACTDPFLPHIVPIRSSVISQVF